MLQIEGWQAGRLRHSQTSALKDWAPQGPMVSQIKAAPSNSPPPPPMLGGVCSGSEALTVSPTSDGRFFFFNICCRATVIKDNSKCQVLLLLWILWFLGMGGRILRNGAWCRHSAIEDIPTLFGKKALYLACGAPPGEMQSFYCPRFLEKKTAEKDLKIAP